MISKKILVILFIIVLFSCGPNRTTTLQSPLPPDIGQDLQAKNGMVTSANKLASQIGVDILKIGGNAVDAAVATAFAVSVTEPEMSGLGGGGAMIIWLEKEKKTIYLDFYSAKRMVTYTNLPNKGDDQPLWEIAIPGEVAGLLYALENHGNLSRKQVMQPAIDLAEDGFPMYRTLAEFIDSSAERLKKYEGSKLFLPDDNPFPVGKIFKQPELAETLREIAEKGADAFYNGPITQDIIDVMNEGGNPVTLQDFRDYKVSTNRGFLKTSYKNWTILTAPSPQGGLEIISDLNLLEPFNLKEMGLPTQSDTTFHVLAAAMRAGIADRQFIADPNWVDAPISVLSSKEFAFRRAKEVFKTPIPDTISIQTLKDLSKTPKLENVNDGETTSLSVIDKDGNAVNLTHTLSSVFGKNAVWVRGFFLNNSGMKFSSVENVDVLDKPKSDYWTRYSTIAPTIILNPNNTVKMVLGAPGGGRIDPAIVQSIIYILDYGMDPATAARMPRIYPNYDTSINIGKGFKGEVISKAYNRGYRFHVGLGGYARIYVIENDNGILKGAADPNHEGGVSGY
ncbi:gamma-glutamyltransferase family protein [Gelidibacter mesophilus]|uniref:gamma-glutamyltransferase family protein n=1 Tax=Gelidibacter mesophilus TaxID=169050 RepID=UPI000402A445|nr:gamma-glutamyltransferase family protein [Gelidibacter mesophilus]